MENRNEKTKNFLKGIVFGAVVVALLAVTVGCSKKKGNQTPNPYGGGYGYGYGNPNYNGYGTSNGVSAGLDNGGQFMLILATNGPQAPGGYGAGPVHVEGELHIFNGMGCPMTGMQTGLMPGRYQLIPYNGSQAMLDVDLLTNAVVEARGPSGSVILTIPYARTFQTNVCGMDGMMGMMAIEAVNGYPCGISAGFSDNAAGGMCGY